MAVMELPRVEVSERIAGQDRRRAAAGRLRGDRGHGVQALTAREREILEAYIRVGLHKLVAEELGITLQTVKNAATNTFAKLGCRSITQACVIYDRHARGFAAPTWPVVDRRRPDDRRTGRERRVRDRRSADK